MTDTKPAGRPSTTRTGFTPLLWALGMRDGLTATTKGVLVALAARANAQGSCYPSVPRLARDACVSERTCQTAIHDLERLGFVTVNRKTGRGHASLYHLDLERVQDDLEEDPAQPIAEERVQHLHSLPDERVQQVHPLNPERVQILQIKGAAFAPQLPIELPSTAAKRVPRKTPRAKSPPNPRRFDSPDRWHHLADQHADGSPMIEVDDRGGSAHALVAGRYLDVVADMVCEAAAITSPNWRGSWEPLLAWLHDGLDLDRQVIPAIRRVAARPAYTPPASLKYFDMAVREFAASQRTSR